MKKIVFLIIFLITGLILPASSQTLNQYWQMAAENNPALKSSFYEYMASMERAGQVGTLPDPQLTFGYFARPMPTLMGNQRAEITLMQMFPWFGMIGTRKDEAAAMARMKYEAFNEAKFRLYYDMRAAWYDLYLLEQEINITKENLKILKTYEQMALVKFKTAAGRISSPSNMGNDKMQNSNNSGNGGQNMSGMQGSSNSNSSTSTQSRRPTSNMSGGGNMNAGGTGMVDVLRVQISIKQMENDIANLELAKKPLLAKFNQILQRQDTASVVLSDTLLAVDYTPEVAAIKDSISRNSPMLKMLEAENESVLAQQKMARLEGRPMVGAGVNYMIFTPGENHGTRMEGGSMFMPMVSLTLPIYRSRYKALLQEATIKLQAIDQQKTEVKNSLNTELAQALADLASAKNNLQLTSTITQMTEQALQVLLTSYMANNSDFEEILRLQEQLLTYQLQSIEAITNQHKAVAKLEMLQGAVNSNQ